MCTNLTLSQISMYLYECLLLSNYINFYESLVLAELNCISSHFSWTLFWNHLHHFHSIEMARMACNRDTKECITRGSLIKRSFEGAYRMDYRVSESWEVIYSRLNASRDGMKMMGTEQNRATIETKCTKKISKQLKLSMKCLHLNYFGSWKSTSVVQIHRQ